MSDRFKPGDFVVPLSVRNKGVYPSKDEMVGQVCEVHEWDGADYSVWTPIKDEYWYFGPEEVISAEAYGARCDKPKTEVESW